jgi:hypothetical protein
MATTLPATAHVTTGHVNVQGVSLEVLHIEGSAVLAPIVFLHEGLGSVAMWRDFPQRVCAATGRAGWVVSTCAAAAAGGLHAHRGARRVACVVSSVQHSKAGAARPF